MYTIKFIINIAEIINAISLLIYVVEILIKCKKH